jgi:hypothetical protein
VTIAPPHLQRRAVDADAFRAELIDAGVLVDGGDPTPRGAPASHVLRIDEFGILKAAARIRHSEADVAKVIDQADPRIAARLRAILARTGGST